MGEGEEEQGSYLKNAEVYNLIAEHKAEAIISMGEDAIPGLVSILEKGESWKKVIAIAILANIDGSSSIRALKVAAEDAESGIRSLAVSALGEKKGKTAERAIERMTGDPSGQVVKKAREALFRRRSSEPPPVADNGMRKRGKKLVVRS